MRIATFISQRNMLCPLVFALLALVWLAGPAAMRARAAAPQPPGKQWAVLVGVEKYRRVTPLRYTITVV